MLRIGFYQPDSNLSVEGFVIFLQRFFYSSKTSFLSGKGTHWGVGSLISFIGGDNLKTKREILEAMSGTPVNNMQIAAMGFGTPPDIMETITDRIRNDYVLHDELKKYDTKRRIEKSKERYDDRRYNLSKEAKKQRMARKKQERDAIKQRYGKHQIYHSVNAFKDKIARYGSSLKNPDVSSEVEMFRMCMIDILEGRMPFSEEEFDNPEVKSEMMRDFGTLLLKASQTLSQQQKQKIEMEALNQSKAGVRISISSEMEKAMKGLEESQDLELVSASASEDERSAEELLADARARVEERPEAPD